MLPNKDVRWHKRLEDIEGLGLMDFVDELGFSDPVGLV